jgi:hypothetical protein
LTYIKEGGLINAIRAVALLILAVSGLCVLVSGATQDENDPEKAAGLIREAIRVRGGDTYLKINTAISRGQFTPFQKGVSDAPTPVIDYIVYPDRERTEFGKGDSKYVQTNFGAKGWIYEAKQKMIRDQTEDQIKDVQQRLRYDLDNLLKRGWKEAGVKLVYVGRREVWRNTFSEAVRLDFADGAQVTLHFDPRAKLPLMTEYKIITEGKTSNEQSRYFRWVEFNGVQFPTIIDLYNEGLQAGRFSVDSVEYNAEVPEKLFAKPVNIKEVK